MEATRSDVYQSRKRRIHVEDGPSIYTWIFVTVALSQMFAVGFLPEYKLLQMPKALNLFLFRSIWNIRVAFLVFTALHVGEGTCAWYLAKRFDPGNAQKWFWQTFVLGFFSLRIMQRKASAARKD